MTAPNWDSATAPVSSAGFSTLLATSCSNILPGIVRSEIGRHDFPFVGSQPNLLMITDVAYFQGFGKWRSCSDEV